MEQYLFHCTAISAGGTHKKALVLQIKHYDYFRLNGSLQQHISFFKEFSTNVILWKIQSQLPHFPLTPSSILVSFQNCIGQYCIAKLNIAK